MNTNSKPTAIAISSDNNIVPLPRHNKDDLRERVSITDVYAALHPAKFSNQKKGGDELLVGCYAHEPDNNPSMAINESKHVFHCHACGESGDVFHLVQKALGCDFTQSIEWVARFVGDYIPPTEVRILPAQPHKDESETITRYEYDGGFVNERHDPVNAKKYFKQFYQGKKHDKLKHPRFPMYRQSECVDAIATGSIWLHDHEGEKCTDYAWELGYPSTTTYGNMRRDEYLPTYQGLKDAIGRPFKVVIYQDAQDGARKAGYKVETLTKLGIDFVVIDWTKHLDKKTGDIVDYVELHGADKFRELLHDAVRSQSTKSPATGGIQSNVVAFPGKSPNDDDIQQLKAELEALLAKSTKKSEISKFKAARSLSPSLARLVDDWVEEFRQSATNDDEKKNLLKVLGNNSSLRLADCLPELLALSMSEWSADVQIPEECVLTAFLPLAAHMLGQSDVRLSSTWVEPSIIFSCIAGKSGSGKSPLFRAIVQQPMMQFQQEIDKEYLQKKEEYEAWKRLPRDQKEDIPEPPEPIRRLAYLSNFTAEALHALADQFPEIGAMVVSDELSEIFNNQGKYSGGKGSDKEEILKAYDSYLGNIGRKSGNSGGRRFFLNISGATQIETLQDLIRRRNVSSGEWSRFFICELPYVKIKHSLVDSEPIDLTPVIVAVCKQLQEYKRQEYRLSPRAFVDHKVFCNEIEALAYEELNEGYRLAIKKAKGQVGRLALVLHCLEDSCNPVSVSPPSQISDRTMAKAIAIMRFYLAQADRLYRLQDVNSLTPDLEAIVSLARRKGSITPGDVARAFSGKRRKSGEQARALMTQLAEMGLGTIKPSGKSIVYLPPSDDVGKVDKVDRSLIKVDKFINDENTLTVSSLDSKESKVDKVDKNFNFPTNIEMPPDNSTTSGGTDTQDIESPKKISTDLSTLSTLAVNEPENQSGSQLENVDKVINFVSTQPSTLSTLENKDPNRVDPSPDAKDPNQPLTLEDIDLGGDYCLDGRRCTVVSFDWASNPPVIDVRFEDDNTKKTILDPRRLRFV